MDNTLDDVGVGSDSSSAEDSKRATDTYTTKDNGENSEAEEKIRKRRISKEEKIRLKQEKWKEDRQKIPKVVDVKWLDVEHFKNVYSPDQGLEIIQVLRGHQRLPSELTREHRRRVPRRWDTKSTSVKIESTNTWPQRVRIQSPPLVILLSRLTGHDEVWSVNEPLVFSRPFRTFYFFLPQVKECLQILEKRWGGKAGDDPHKAKLNIGDKATKTTSEGKTEESVEDQSAASDLGNVSDAESDLDTEYAPKNDDNRISAEDAIMGEVTDSVAGLQHIRKYVQFVEENIMPDWEKAKSTTHRKVRFFDLFMYFIPGELLYAPSKTDRSQSSAGIARQSCWRLYCKDLDMMSDNIPDDWQPNKSRRLDLYSYHIDYNGSYYGPVEIIHSIYYYEGEKDITTLDVYPMRFVKDSQQVKNKLYEQGKTFQNVIKDKHLHYDGWTLNDFSSGNGENYTTIEIEHIDGDVIIDFLEGFKANPSILIPNFSDTVYDDVGWQLGDDVISIRYWSDGPNSELLAEGKEFMVRNEMLIEFQKIRHRKHSILLQTWQLAVEKPPLEGDDLALLPRRAVAYAFRERKFVMVDTLALRKISPQQNVFRDLKIDEEHKQIVMSLVKSHFRKQKLQKLQPGVGLNQDLIRGKGSGLFILLHGVPGVGKTATAEAVAQANKKPLFVITCGDLGFSPKEVEVSLGNIFRLAHLWDCVLLLDEADIFLTRREHNDLKRNALVSVFLRVLEYYSGILFLTTNRVGILDEAFKSRIHISMYYPPLSREYTIAIFEVNIRKLRSIEKEKRQLETAMEADPSSSSTPHLKPKRPALIIDEKSIKSYAAWHYDHHKPHQRWNGRQIRNAFQIAYSLADFDMQRSPSWEDADFNLDSDSDADADASPEGEPKKMKQASRLDYRQFQIVDKAIERFDSYLLGAMKGNTDTDYARLSGTRDDDHDVAAAWEQGPVYRSPRPRPQPRQNQKPTSIPQEFGGRPAAGSRRSPVGGGRRPDQQQEYQPPPEFEQDRRKRGLAPPDMRRGGEGNSRVPSSSPRGSGGTQRTKPRSVEQEYELGHPGWSMNAGGRSNLKPHAATGGFSSENEEYAPRGEEREEGEYYDDEYEEDENYVA